MSRYAAMTEDSRWKRLRPTDRRFMRVLLSLSDPKTGSLESMSAVELAGLLEVNEETLRQSRLRLIAAGLIVFYQPGTGHTASSYRIAQSWTEAEEVAALRQR